MSFTDEYLELRKKKKKQEEKDIAPLFTNKTTAFFDKDIAPVNNKVTYSDVSSKKEEEDKPWYKSGVFADGFQAGDINQIILSHGKALKDDYLTGGSESAEDDTEVPWYKKGRFEDGYDFGDVTKTILGVDEDTASLKDLTWNSIKRGYYNARFGEESFAAMQGQANNADELKKLLEGEDYQFTPGNNFASGVSGAFELVGQMARQYTNPRTLALTGTAAGAAAIAGQAGPQVLVPEEVVTVPTAAIAGFASGSAVAALEIEGGLAYNEMVEAGISAETASKIALAVGTVNAGLEMLQTDELIDAFKATNKAGTKTFTQRILSELKDRGIDIAKETAQEVAQEGVTITGTQVGSKIDNGEWAYTAEDVGNRLLDTAKSSALSFGMMNVPAAGKNIVSIANEQKQENTLTDNEKKVVDKVVEDRIAEEEQDGKELTDKEKTNIRKGVLDELVKGYISTDTIEEVLGGETYKTYKETVDSEDALQSEFDALYKMKQGDMTGEQIDRMGELRKRLSDLATTSQRNQLKTQLNDEVLGLVNGSRLAESYNERARRGQAFEADLTKYDAKQQAVVQKAIDSGILNNTNRTHEFVDMVAKISADKGVLFDFTNNEKLKNSGFAVDGKSVNGYVTKDGVTVNIQSSKSLNSVVGHEITHVLEGTELYDTLQQTMFDYAKSKGEYDSRLANLTELYKDIKDADVNAELTADLVGDYLFTDKEFVQHLSVNNRNIFQKIYDEIKYLCKVATAGSKEARELERVKKAFEDAYRGNGKVTDTKYSITESPVKQEISSAGTSLNQIPALFKDKNVQFGKTNIDIGGGKFNQAKNFLAEQGTDSMIFDPYNRGAEENKATLKYLQDGNKADTATCANVLNVIAEPAARSNVILEAAKSIKPDGTAYFMVYEGNGSGVGKQTSAGWQNNRKTADYVGEISEWFETVQRKGKLIIAKDPIANLPKASWEVQPGEAVRYSISDSDGKQLTKEQQDYFKDSKMRDADGNLKVMYHGSQDAGFHVFDSSMSDDDTSFFFVDRNDVAASYSGTTETYEARTIRTPEDMNSFLAEIGYDSYKAVEKDGKFELLENNEHVATKDTMQEIYEEFCWYEGVGEGDANYKVYLNLKNPLVVDAEGKNWNNVSREFSPELADKYRSLTADEKAALHNLASWEDVGIFRDEIRQALADTETGTPGTYDEAFAKNVRSAYEKLGGNKVNMYDLFSIAEDNFSDLVIEAYAVKQMNTRDFAQRAKEQGYDGVIFNNIVDVGGYSNGSEGAATVAVAFDSSQIKSVANEKPTADPDIRYSLTEYTEEEKIAHNKAVVDHFGKTYKWAETGYILLDGSKLDLSGKHEGAPGGYRTVDHRDIVDALGSDYGDDTYSGSLVQFMSEGNIRISPESDGINLSVKPNKAQEAALASFIQNAHGEVLLDIDDANGYTVVSVEYPSGTSAFKVLNDIRGWFDNGTKPEVSNISQFRYSLSEQTEYAPTFYSHMAKVVDDTRQQKLGAASVVNMLRGKGVKAEEIKWSGIEDWLEDKKSVTKEELQEFIKGSQLQIEETVLADGDGTLPYTEDERQDLQTLTDLYSRRMDWARGLWQEAYGEEMPLTIEGADDVSAEISREIIRRNGGTRDFVGVDAMSEAEQTLYTEVCQALHVTDLWIEQIRERAEARQKNTSNTHWSDYKLNGGENYREYLFKMPGSDYRNPAMDTHWKGERGVLAHARVQDFDTADGKMLFVEEIQSDWHNEGQKYGYKSNRNINKVIAERDLLEAELDKIDKEYEKALANWDAYTALMNPDEVAETNALSERRQKVLEKLEALYDESADIENEFSKKAPNAPFKSNYHEFVLKRLIREAAEKGYDSIGWTTADIQSDRWSPEYGEGYRIEYDQDIPKFLNKYGKKWGAQVEKAMLDQGWAASEDEINARKKLLADWYNSLASARNEAEVDFVREQIKHTEDEIRRLQETGETVWSMPITEAMKQSVLHEGQPMYSLSDEGQQFRDTGGYKIYGKDILLDKGDIAPVAETAKETAKTEQNVPIAEDVTPETEDLFPNDLAPVEAELDSLYQQKDLLESKMQEAITAEDMEAWTKVSAEYDSVMAKIAELESAENERFDSLVNEEAPPETVRQYDSQADNTPIAKKDIADIAKEAKETLALKSTQMGDFRKLIEEYSQSENPSREQLFKDLKENFGTYKERGFEQSIADAKKYLRSTKLLVNDTIIGDIADFADFKKRNRGKVILSANGGLDVDVAYQELNNLYPHLFPESISNPTDQLLQIVDVANKNSTTWTEKPIDDNTLWEVANDIADNVSEMKQIQKEADANELAGEAFTDLVAHGDDFAPIDNSAITETPVTEENTVTTNEAPIAEEYEAIRPKPSKEPKLARATPAEQARAEILTEEPKVNKDKPNAWAKVKNLVLDKGMVFEDLSLATGNRELQARYNSIRYAEGKAQKLIGEGNAFTNSLKSIQETVEKSGKTKDFYYYLYHKHNIDRMTLEERFKDTPNKPVFGDTISAEDSRQSAAVLENANPEFKQWAEDVYSFNKYLREQLVEGGVISRETADLWETMYPHYVPIRREGDAGLNVNVPLDTGRTGVNAPIKKATGGSRNILPLFDTMGQRAIQTYKAIAKNRFGVELKNTLGTTIENDVVGVDEAIDSIDTQDGLLQEGKNGKKPTFTVFENGKKVTFEITEEMYDAMKPTSDLFSGTSKVLNTISNVRRGTLTEYNPWFMLKNAVKDIQDVLINSQHATKTYANIPSAIKQMATNGHWYQEYMDNGGDQNTYFDNETNTFAKDNKALEVAKKVTGLDAISKANNIIERLPRLAEYIASRKAGRSVDVAMLDAARVTTNFAAGGDATKWLNRNGATFLNASVQGAVQQARNIREAKANGLKGWASLAAKYTLAGLPAVLLNSLLWDDDEEYEELSEYVKENYYIVGKFGDGKFVRIPKGRTVAVIQNAFEQMENLITGEDEVDLGRFLDLVVTNLAPNNPLDNNIISPIVQVANNETWYGEDLVPTRLQDLPEAEQYDESTDSISRWLGEKLDFSPVKINYLLDQYSGVIGDTFLPMLTPEAESGDNSFMGNMIAPLKDMFSTDSVMNNQNVSDFYETMDELTTNAKSSTATDEDVLKYKYINSVNAELSELYAQKRELQNSDLADDRKYQQVRKIQERIDAMTEESLNTYNDVNIDGIYATVGDRHYRWYEPGEDSDAEAGWQKITDKQLEKQEDVTSGLGISASEYWSNKEEYDYAYENPEKYAVAKSVGGYKDFKNYSSELYDIKADKDSSGKSISGSRKEKVIDYVNSLDIDYGMRLILFKNEYNADDTYNYDIINYLNSREDISYEDMVSILKELGFTVDSEGQYHMGLGGIMPPFSWKE